MSAEPDTRPFSSAELAHFLEQFELDRPSARSSVITARAPRIVGAERWSEPRTMLGMGGLPVKATGPRPSAPPSRGGDSSRAAPRGPRGLFVEPEPRRLSVRSLWSLGLGVAVVFATASFVAALCWAPSVVTPRSGSSSAVPLPARGLRAPPPLPPLPVVARPPAHAGAVVSAPALVATTTASPKVEPIALPGLVLPALVLPTAKHEAAASTTSPRSGMHVLPTRQAPPLGRVAARREAVDLLLAGHTRAALAVYRELPPTLRNEPALTHVIRLLERELGECRQTTGAGCGT